MEFWPSWATTLWGPNQWPPFASGCHSMTHSPGSYARRSGRDRLRHARRSAWSLSAWWKAILAFSLRARFWRKAIPWASSRQALARDDTESQLLKEPGSRELFPNTKISGENPLRMLSVFFACVHCAKTCWSSVYVWIGESWSTLLSMDWSMWPCLSHRPFCQWACGAVVVAFTSFFWRNSIKWLLVNSVPASVTSTFGGPAHWNQLSATHWAACSTARLGAGVATWKFVAWSKIW